MFHYKKSFALCKVISRKFKHIPLLSKYISNDPKMIFEKRLISMLDKTNHCTEINILSNNQKNIIDVLYPPMQKHIITFYLKELCLYKNVKFPEILQIYDQVLRYINSKYNIPTDTKLYDKLSLPKGLSIIDNHIVVTHMIIMDNEVIQKMMNKIDNYDEYAKKFINLKINEISLKFLEASNQELYSSNYEFVTFTNNYNIYDNKPYIILCLSQLRDILETDNFIGLCENILALYDQCLSNQYYLCKQKKNYLSFQ